MVIDWCKDFREHGMICLWIGWIPYIIIFKAELLEPILKSNKHITKSDEYSFLHPWLGRGLLTSNGTKWQTRRKMLTSAFHFHILNAFMQVFNEKAEILVENLEEKAKGNAFNISPILAKCALDIICETAMGESVNAQTDSGTIVRITYLIMKRQRSPWMWPYFLFRMFPSGIEHAKCLKILHKMTTTVIENHAKEFKELLKKQKAEGALASLEPQTIGKRKRLAFLDLLLCMHFEDPCFTFSDIREEVDTFMFEGHDTTAAAVNWAMYLLGSNLDVQKRLHEELDGVFGNDGVKIPENTHAFVLTAALHRDERFFPDSEKFLPERFLPENSVTRHPFAYIPFSAGPRNCIGQRFATFEEKVILIHVFRKFKVESLQSFEDLKLQAQLILRPSTGTIVKLIKRN
ncbi:cytochrome P450 4V2-like [Anneissia japonica]|uniref:cytochrome P450 4V2-like n=1 Tax=Anneissia japonica TaxID=1529436 RepID=UPI0014255A08|nr:cytochrome P450 4V2-like [Anneissia japonica]